MVLKKPITVIKYAINSYKICYKNQTLYNESQQEGNFYPEWLISLLKPIGNLRAEGPIFDPKNLPAPLQPIFNEKKEIIGIGLNIKELKNRMKV